MAYRAVRRAGFRALLSAMLAAAQWRLLLLWLLLMLLPATVVVLPLWRVLSGLLDHSVHAAALAAHFNAAMFGDVAFALSDSVGWLGGAAVLGLMLTLLLSPFLDGMIIGSGRAGRTLGFGSILQQGFVEYGRMFRMMLWSLPPYLLVIGAGMLGSHLAADHADQAVLESQADLGLRVAGWGVVVVFVLMQAIVESARAAFIADPSLRSATRALGRAIRQLILRPLTTLGFYLVVTLSGLALAGATGVARMHVSAVGVRGFVAALVLGQLMVALIGWMRTARLFALAKVASSI